MPAPRVGLPRALKKLFDWLDAGSGIKEKPQIAALTAISTADATDPATTMALANINKAKINAIIAALKA